MSAPIHITQDNASYCYLDLDINHHRDKLALSAAFVDATDTRYGLSSPDLRLLGGSELSRLPELLTQDHEWKNKILQTSADITHNRNGILVKPPQCGNRLVVQLDWDIAPLACENFATLCSNGGGDRSFTTVAKVPPAPMGDSGKPLTYRSSKIHRFLPGFIVQGGDFVFGNGSGGESIWNGKQKFKDERAGLLQKHNQRGILSMGNSGKNSNTSQFFITLAPAPQCDGKHVIFGKVVSGMEILSYLEQVEGTDGSSEVPQHDIVITDCGIWTPLQTPASGYWYDKPDADSFSGISPLFLVRPRIAVIVPNAAAAEKFTKSLGHQCVVVFESSSHKDQKTTSISEHVVNHWLEGFRADVVLVAPACKDVLQQISQLPESWSTRQEKYHLDISLEKVVLEAKPVEALSIVQQQSWLANTNQRQQQTWQLDGVMA